MNLPSLPLLLPRHQRRLQLLTCPSKFSTFQPLLLAAAWYIVTDFAWWNQDQGTVSLIMWHDLIMRECVVPSSISLLEVPLTVPV